MVASLGCFEFTKNIKKIFTCAENESVCDTEKHTEASDTAMPPLLEGNPEAQQNEEEEEEEEDEDEEEAR